MMGHCLCLCYRQRLDPTGGHTESIFPEVDELLQDSDYQEALEHLTTHAARKNMEVYRSMVDFLFCELHPQWRRHCRMYYAEKGPALREDLPKQEREPYERRMLAALRLAFNTKEVKRRRNWGWFRAEVEATL